jgi:hypothetical protein
LDDLNTPLGKKPARVDARWKSLVLPLITGVLGIMVVVALAWVILVDNPLGGEPMATAKIELPQAAKDDPPNPLRKQVPCSPTPRASKP